MKGSLAFRPIDRVLYATDASVYRSKPLGVAFPRNTADIISIVRFSSKHGVPLIPRAAGTSLAGQVVGKGLVVDVSKHMHRILEINAQERWVRVQPGVIRDDLNRALKSYGLFFSPNTSTSNRCMIGGMVGNNSCGTTSIKYGTTRDKLLEVRVVLSDGSEAVFGAVDDHTFHAMRKQSSLEGRIYQDIYDQLSSQEVRQEIFRRFPHKDIHRRNTGFALDALAAMRPFDPDGPPMNLCALLAGSEGTLAMTTEVKLQLDPLPPAFGHIIAVHFDSLDTCLRSVVTAMSFEPYACELMDKTILDCTKDNIKQARNRFFIDGDPEALLLVELRDPTPKGLQKQVRGFIETFEKHDFGYAHVIVDDADCARVWELRSAGLGVLSNIPGDKKAVACIEDTAVRIEDLADYIAEFNSVLERFGQQAVHYAHAGAGEIHIRPLLDLKNYDDVILFKQLSKASSDLVRKYRGSLSGEHGDGRVRGPFIKDHIGEKNYAILRSIKSTWDPDNIFNPGKIIDVPPMTEDLRYAPGQETKTFDTILDFEDSGGLLRMVEKCNGSGDCRKSSTAGGTMCPSYHATRDEVHSTRGRANVLREYLTRTQEINVFNQEALRQVLDLCLSCKGCTAECPSNVDMAAMKAEVYHQYYKHNGVPLRSKLFAHINSLNNWSYRAAPLVNTIMNSPVTGPPLKRMLGIARERAFPRIQHATFIKWLKGNASERMKHTDPVEEVVFFADAFTNFYDVDIGKRAVLLLSGLGYNVRFVAHEESGRAAISKGFLAVARRKAERNIEIFAPLAEQGLPIVGLEPSAILTFRDEYPKLIRGKGQEKARKVADQTFLIDEFLAHEIEAGRIGQDQFDQTHRKILFHGHCHQKALSDAGHSALVLSFPVNHDVEVIPSGCCGMAGSFGYENEHYDISMRIGELILFPAIRSAGKDVIVAATGTSCRQQIMDGTKRVSLHPVEILYDALVRTG